MFPSRAPYIKRRPYPKPYVAYSSGSPVKEPPTSTFPSQSSLGERYPTPRALFHSSFKVPGIQAPFQVPSFTELQKNNFAHYDFFIFPDTLQPVSHTHTHTHTHTQISITRSSLFWDVMQRWLLFKVSTFRCNPSVSSSRIKLLNSLALEDRTRLIAPKRRYLKY